jgi:hypothetical protein
MGTQPARVRASGRPFHDAPANGGNLEPNMPRLARSHSTLPTARGPWVLPPLAHSSPTAVNTKGKKYA